MRIGLFISDVSGAQTDVDELLANARAAEALGFTTGWVPHIPWSLDGLTALALAGQVTNRIELGTAVMPTYPRHPMAMAQQAMSTQAATGGRLVLGHRAVAPGGHREHVRPRLRAAGPPHPGVRRGAAGRVRGRRATSSTTASSSTSRRCSTVPGSTPAPIMVAALAPRMLQLAGELTDGTITYWANERARRRAHRARHHRRPPTAAGRPAPRVVVGLPVAVCDDADAGRERAAKIFAAYLNIPTYQRVLARGGDGTTPTDVAVIGTEAEVDGAPARVRRRRRDRPVRDRAGARRRREASQRRDDRAAGVARTRLLRSRTMTKAVRLEFDGPIATITNDNPDKHNAFDDDMDLAAVRHPRRARRARPTCGR